MSLAPISQISNPFEDYPGYFLKGYEQGTVNPLVMSIDNTGITTVAKAEISSGGVAPIGFIKTAGNVIFIPYFDEAYDLWLFPTAAEADANDTSNAVLVADNMSFLVDLSNKDGLIKKFDETPEEEIKFVIINSINNGWQGLFWDRYKQNTTKELKDEFSHLY